MEADRVGDRKTPSFAGDTEEKDALFRAAFKKNSKKSVRNFCRAFSYRVKTVDLEEFLKKI